MPITALPTPPSRSDPANFATRGDNFLGSLPTFVSEANLLASVCNTNEINSTAAANAAVSVSNVTAWVSGTTYAQGVSVYSLIDFLTYRRKIAGAGTTDPSLDNTNWVLIIGQGNSTLSGNNTWTGTNTFNNTIKGDFSNADLTLRTSFQSGTVNGLTYIHALPNGTSNNAGWAAWGSSNPNNSNYVDISNNGVEARIRSGVTGTGTQLPLTFYTTGLERLRIAANGNTSIGTSTTGFKLTISDTANGNELVRLAGDGSSTAGFGVTTGDILKFYTGGIERFRYDQSIGLVLTNSGTIGYGVGAGGVVVQSTDKFSTVTLNKASGRITTAGTLLAANNTVNFVLSNSLITPSSLIVVNVVGGVTDFRNYNVWAGFNSSGSVQIALRNISASNLSEAVQIQFAVFNGATA